MVHDLGERNVMGITLQSVPVTCISFTPQLQYNASPQTHSLPTPSLLPANCPGGAGPGLPGVPPHEVAAEGATPGSGQTVAMAMATLECDASVCRHH